MTERGVSPCGLRGAELQAHRPGRDAARAVHGDRDHAVKIEIPRGCGRVDPFDATLLPEAVLVIEYDLPDLRIRRGHCAGARRTLDHEPVEVVHLAPAAVARRPVPVEADALRGRDRGQ